MIKGTVKSAAPKHDTRGIRTRPAPSGTTRTAAARPPGIRDASPARHENACVPPPMN